MHNLIYKEISKKEDWEKFVLSQGVKSFLQSWNWGETNKLLGKKIYRLGFYQGEKLVGVSLVIVEEARRGKHFLIPGGPLLNWDDQGLRNYFLKVIKSLGKKENAWFVRIRPEVSDLPENRKMFSRMGFISAPMHLHAENTWVLNINQPDEKLLSGMRKTTRYLIRKSLNMGLTLDKTVDPQKTSVLTNLQKETVIRHKFVGFSDSLFKNQLITFGVDSQAELYICKNGKFNLAAAIIIFYGDMAYYHHSASTSEFREIPFSYFLQWKIITEARERGLKYYNFWGIAPNDDPNHRFAGVTTFKKGFGGERVDWLHARDLVISPLYYFTYLFELFRKSLRRL
jgi:lipid II:glycine glycyltransferase (peptidoglycan interpeptide bridge formation enzyme)